MKKIAITGTIGSGKSYVSNLIKKNYHFPILDVDVVAKQVRSHQARNQIIHYFGKQILTNKEIDPKKLGAIIFQDDQKRKALEAMIHPAVYEEILKFMDVHQSSKLIFVEHPLVYELGWEHLFDEIWLVTCDPKVAIQRLIEYRGYNKEQAIQILSKQEENESKQKKANRMIYNDYEESLIKQLNTIMKEEQVC